MLELLKHPYAMTAGWIATAAIAIWWISKRRKKPKQ
jgi:hypothetical protein